MNKRKNNVIKRVKRRKGVSPIKKINPITNTHNEGNDLPYITHQKPIGDGKVHIFGSHVLEPSWFVCRIEIISNKAYQLPPLEYLIGCGKSKKEFFLLWWSFKTLSKGLP